ncbi:MAG: DUF72 domain-containing protein [Nitrososphaeraceae archaeon]
MKFYLGCSGWSYEGWKGTFYPNNLDNKYWLSYYSNIFKFVEVDSTFYRIPSHIMVQNWFKRTPDNFKFAVKFPKEITHDKRNLSSLSEKLNSFYKVMKPLQKKIVAFLIQLPPWLNIVKGLEFLESMEYQLDNSYRYAIETRHTSWFNELAYNYFKKNNYCLVWSQRDKLVTPPIVTTDFVYLRLIGNRSIDEKNFGKIMVDRTDEMQLWSKMLLDIQRKETNVNMAIVSANNHYAGFGPESAKLLSEMLNQEDKINKFPLHDYKIPNHLFENTKFGNNYKINKELNSKRKRQTEISEFFK